MNDQLILVVGATGNQGTAVCNQLLADGYLVRAMVRKSDDDKAKALADKGAQLIVADLEDRASLDQAVAGAYGVFAVLRFFQEHQEQETEQGKRLADAAKVAGVQHFVYSSVASAHRKTGVPHLDSKWYIEQYIRRIGLPHTILGPVAFNYSMEEFKGPVSQGMLPYAFRPNTLVFQLDEHDYARFVSLAFSNPEQWLGYRYDVASDALTAAELAETFARVTGRPVLYQQITWEDEIKTAGQEVVNLMQWIERIGPDILLDSRRREYPWLTPFETYLRQNGWENLPVTDQTEKH